MLPSATELTTRIARCIGIWETNRGKNDPAPKESSLDTVSGVRASMATIEQATMPYAIDAIRTHTKLQGLADPPLTKKQLNDADACCKAVVNLLNLVTKAAGAGTDPAAFIQKKSSEIAQTYLRDSDVKTMFKAVALKKRIDAANAAVAKGSTLDAEVKKFSKSERLGLGAGSLKSYIRTPKNWGENRAGWQRKAVNAMPNNIGARIQRIAESANGTALVTPVVRSRVDKELKKKKVPSLENIVRACSVPNNPNEKDYGTNIWKTYTRLYGT